MLKKIFYLVVILVASIPVIAQPSNEDTFLVLPFKNKTQDKSEFNWVGESFAASLVELLQVPRLRVISNNERKTVQQRLRIPLTSLPSLATSLKLARESRATLLVLGDYSIIPSEGDSVATLTVTVRIIRVNEGRFLNEEGSDGKRFVQDINLTDALGNLQTMEAQIAYRLLYQRDKAFFIPQKELIDLANKVPARAFEAYIKGLLTSVPDARENYFKNALRLYGEGVPDGIYAEAALELGHLYFDQKKFGESIDSFSQAVTSYSKCRDRAKSESKVAVCDDDRYAEASFYIGLIHWHQGNYEPALAALRPLAEDLKLVSVYNTIGAISVRASRSEKKNPAKAAGMLTEGQGFLKKALDSAPEKTDLRFNYAASLFFSGSCQEAIDHLKQVIAANPRDGEAYYLLAKALETQKDPTAADIDSQARRYLTQDNKYANLEKEWLKTKSVSDITLRVDQPARRDFLSVVLVQKQSQPTAAPIDETEALLMQARAFYKDGRDEEALGVLRRVLTSEPMNAESHLLTAKMLLRAGNRDQAISSFKTAIFWDNALIDAYISLGKIYLERGDCLQAKNNLASALQLNAENPEVLGLQRQVDKCSK